MACKGCSCSTSSSSSKSGDTVAGCGSNGCATGGCNRMNTFDWLAALDIEDPNQFDTVEISFKNGSRKEFFKNPTHTRAMTGDMVLVESDNGGYDLGRISLSGELVRSQMKKKGIKEKTVLQSVIRRANERDLERLQEAREAEKPTMVKARAISRALGLDMKVGDVEYQGDKRKATFYYTADGRVDFRELIREFAREFKVKIEMRQIGARQESARVGGLGPCGRELCCSTWLTDFKSVSTVAARYQNLAINQSKLSGQCGRLKCCLNYELDTYIDALEHFPSHADRIQTEEGSASLMKTDIFKGLMYYCYDKDHGRGKFYPLEIEQVKEILDANKRGERPKDLSSVQLIEEVEDEVGFDGNLTGVVELPSESRNKKKRTKKRRENDSPAPKGRFDAPKRTGGEDRNKPNNEARPKSSEPRREGSFAERPPRPERTGNDRNVEGRHNRPPRPERDANDRNNEGRELNKETKMPKDNRQPKPVFEKANPNNNRPNQPRPPRPERDANENNRDNRPPKPVFEKANPNNRPNEPRPPRPERDATDKNIERPNNNNNNNRPPQNNGGEKPQNEQRQGNPNKNRSFKNFKSREQKPPTTDKES
jgi:cell fate regulator YaaT (PSP1 superfamily)